MSKDYHKTTECVVSPDRKPLVIKDDPINGNVTIQGVKYSYELLNGFAKDIPENKPFRIVRRISDEHGIYVTIGTA